MTKKITKIKASLKILGRTFTAEGKNLEEVVANLNPDIKQGVGVLTLEKGKVKREKVLPSGVVYRLFGNLSPTMKNIAVKQLNLFFDSKEFN